MNYTQVKKLDEDSLKKLKEGTGPSDKCICSLLSPENVTKKGIRASIKKAFATIAGQSKKRGNDKTVTGQHSVDIPLTFSKGGNGIYTTKEAVKRKSTCGKCGCDNENIVLKHSYANIRITSPDVSSICPCPSDCLPDKNKLHNNIKVTIEHVSIVDADSEDSECSLYDGTDRRTVSEPTILMRKQKQAAKTMSGEWSDGNSDGSSDGSSECNSEEYITIHQTL